MRHKRYITINQAAEMIGVTPLTLRNWDKSGKLVALRNPFNNYRIYKKEDIDLFLRKIESKRKIMLG
jgi:DNA-binding transcriptional MerR regulator